MAGYSTPLDLCRTFGFTEIAQRLNNEGSEDVSGDLFKATILGTSRVAWTSDEQAAADDCLLRLKLSQNNTTGLINSYVGQIEDLPLPSIPLALKKAANDIDRYTIYDDGVPEDIRQRYEDAVTWLESVAKGDVTLGIGDETGGSGRGVSVRHVVRV